MGNAKPAQFLNEFNQMFSLQQGIFPTWTIFKWIQSNVFSLAWDFPNLHNFNSVKQFFSLKYHPNIFGFKISSQRKILIEWKSHLNALFQLSFEVQSLKE